MEYTNVREPFYSSADNSTITAYVTFIFPTLPDPHEIPFTAELSDDEDYSIQIYNECLEGVWGTISPYVPPDETVSDSFYEDKINKLMLSVMLKAFPLQTLVDMQTASEKQKRNLIKLKKFSIDLMSINLEDRPVSLPAFPIME